MTIIYSNKVIDSLKGQYIEPFRFTKPEKGVKLVYTDDSKIAKNYEGICKVLPITVKQTKATK